MIQKDEIDEVEKLLENVNKKKVIIPYETVSGILIKKGYLRNAINII